MYDGIGFQEKNIADECNARYLLRFISWLWMNNFFSECVPYPFQPSETEKWLGVPDRKSTRLNSSHDPW
jgi:hypothetical protein